jgi:hypothetical protein
MSKGFIKIITVTAGIFLVAGSFIYIVRYVANTGVSEPVNQSGPIVSLPGGPSDRISVRNPAQSTNFADIGSGVYVSDERQLGKEAGFSMSYFSEDGSIAIDISSQPLASYREKASRYLLQELGITEAEACELNVYVGVTHETDKELVGKNLGLSFCPNSVKL